MSKEVNKTRQALADMFVASLEKQELPWTKPWTTQSASPMELRNVASGRKYNGVNKLYLWIVSLMRGYTDPRWCTYKQAEERGWHVKRGEHGYAVEYWLMFDKESKKSYSLNEARRIIHDDPDREENFILYAKNYTVFNGAQIEGIPALPEKETKSPDPEFKNIVAKEFFETYLDREGITLMDGTSAYYRPLDDTITLPPKKDFLSEEAYFDTAFHEAIHSTAKDSRVKRVVNYNDPAGRAFEELIAEIGGAFTTSEVFGEVSRSIQDNNVSYIQSWAAEIKKDPNVIARAIQQAETATNYLIEHGDLVRIREVHAELHSEHENVKIFVEPDTAAVWWTKKAPDVTAESTYKSYQLSFTHFHGLYGILSQKYDLEHHPENAERFASELERAATEAPIAEGEIPSDPDFVGFTAENIPLVHEKAVSYDVDLLAARAINAGEALYGADGAVATGNRNDREEFENVLEQIHNDAEILDNDAKPKQFDGSELEKHIPHSMRFKQYDTLDDGVYWVTQEPFCIIELRAFQAAMREHTDVEKFYVTCRDLSPGYNFKDDAANHILAVVTPDSIEAEDYIQAMIDAGMGEQVSDRHLSEVQYRTMEYAEKYMNLPLQEQIDIIATTLGAQTGKIETTPCYGKWRGTSDMCIRFDNGETLFLENHLTPKAKQVGIQREAIKSALRRYNPEIVQFAKETALPLLRRHEEADNAVAAEKGLKPYHVLSVEMVTGKEAGYLGWYYAILDVGGKVSPIMETGMCYNIVDGVDSWPTRPYFPAGATPENAVDFVFRNVGHSTTTTLYKPPMCDSVRTALRRAEESLIAEPSLDLEHNNSELEDPFDSGAFAYSTPQSRSSKSGIEAFGDPDNPRVDRDQDVGR